jgi:8-hydroxy-5-deazaflavin:NADPH oxidoreductase
MRIGIIGAGNIGGTAARLFADAGHEVVISNSRGPETLSAEEGDGVRAATVEEASEHGDVVLVAIPFRERETLPTDALEDTIVIDAMNYYPGRDGQIAELDDDSTTSTELLARHLDGSRLVKAFNTLEAGTLEEEGGRRAGDHSRLVLFVSGDDGMAKRTVMELIDEIGFDPVDLGELGEGGRHQQPGSPIYGAELTNPEAREALGLP